MIPTIGGEHSGSVRHIASIQIADVGGYNKRTDGLTATVRTGAIWFRPGNLRRLVACRG